MKRVYAPRDATVDRAFELVVELGLSSPGASQAEKLGKVIAAGESVLSDRFQELERARAYEEIGRDEERSSAIRESVLEAARLGLV